METYTLTIQTSDFSYNADAPDLDYFEMPDAALVDLAILAEIEADEQEDCYV